MAGSRSASSAASPTSFVSSPLARHFRRVPLVSGPCGPDTGPSRYLQERHSPVLSVQSPTLVESSPGMVILQRRTGPSVDLEVSRVAPFGSGVLIRGRLPSSSSDFRVPSWMALFRRSFLASCLLAVVSAFRWPLLRLGVPARPPGLPSWMRRERGVWRAVTADDLWHMFEQDVAGVPDAHDRGLPGRTRASVGMSWARPSGLADEGGVPAEG